jgi:predicted metal-binding membrane protein
MALLFVASWAVTIVWCGSMSSMGGMMMPGGWTMSMVWMKMSGQTWVGLAASFVGMWDVMMVAMMLPSLLPMLWRHRQAAIVGAAYFFVWTIIGVAVFVVGVAIAKIEMDQPTLSRAVPIASGVVVMIVGALQFTTWKARQLARCREIPARGETAWRHGLRLGLQCSYSCSGLMAILLVLGVMDLRVMAVVTAAITAERLAPVGASHRVARAIGAITLATGVLLSITRW